MAKTKFIQLVELHTADVDKVKDNFFQWVEALMEQAYVIPVITVDLEMPGWVMVIVMYDDVEEAVRVGDYDITKYFQKKLEDICIDGPFYRNLEVVE